MTPINQCSSCHFLVIIALKEEFGYFKDVVNVQETCEIIEKVKVYHFQLPAREGLVQGFVSVIEDMGNENSNSLANKLIPKLNPQLLLNIGISGLLSDDLRLGDVVIATEANDYLHRSKIIQPSDAELTGNEIHFGGKTYNSPDWLLASTKQLEDSIIKTWRSDAIRSLKQVISSANFNFLKDNGLIEESKTPSIHRGAVASGPFVVASNNFKNSLLKQNRNFLAVDMESSGVLKAADQNRGIEALVLRGISDFADERKTQLDKIEKGAIRRWAMTNASAIFLELVKNIDLDFESISIPPDFQVKLEEELHRIIVKKHLAKPYTEISRVQSGSCSWQTFSQFFSFVSDTSLPKDRSNLFESVAKAINEIPLVQNVSLQVEGTSGTGKTSFLSLLYWYFWEQYQHKYANLLPVFLNLYVYNQFSSHNDALSEFKKNTEPLKKIANYFPEQPLVVIIDGFDRYGIFKECLSSYFLSVIKPCTYCKIVGLRSGSDLSQTSVNYISLKSIRISDPSYPEFIRIFLSISQIDGLKEETLKRIIEEHCQLTEVDLFTLGLIIKIIKKAKKTEQYDFYLALIRYCREFVQERFPDASDMVREKLLIRAAQLAFEDEVKSRLPRSRNKSQDSLLRELIARHSILSDFLIAYHTIESLLKIGNYKSEKKIRKTAETLKYIYPYRINKLCKMIINRASDTQDDTQDNTQEKASKVIATLLKQDGIHLNVKVNGCYFAGRFSNEQIRNIAKEVLNNLKEELEKKLANKEPDKHDLFLFRSLHISLILLGDISAKSNYLKYLLTDPKGEEFNRGFHLEYYGDQEYKISITELISTDKLDVFTNTLKKLSKKILFKPNNLLFEIELHTLCSLAQHRHAVGKLDPKVRTYIIEIIQKVKNKVYNYKLQTYVSVISDHLKHEEFHIARVFEDYYKIKYLRRTGWVKRGVDNGESVAEHTYGAYLIALFLLPDEWDYPDYPNYDKQKIMKMLLIHDLAEAIIGDIPPPKTEQDEKREREEYEKLGMLGTYDGLSIMHDVAELWKEFENKQTTNSKIAKDIDLLENLVQLRVYKYSKGYEIEDFEKWSQSLIDSLRTPLGRQVLDKLEKSSNFC